MSWSTALKQPVPLPEGGTLKTLHDIRAHVLDLPDKEREKEAWHTVAEALLYAADQGGAWLVFARIATMQALYRPAQPKYGSRKAAGTKIKPRHRKPGRDDPKQSTA